MKEENITAIIIEALKQEETVVLESTSFRCITGKKPVYTKKDIEQLIDKLKGEKHD